MIAGFVPHLGHRALSDEGPLSALADIPPESCDPEAANDRYRNSLRIGFKLQQVIAPNTCVLTYVLRSGDRPCVPGPPLVRDYRPAESSPAGRLFHSTPKFVLRPFHFGCIRRLLNDLIRLGFSQTALPVWWGIFFEHIKA